MSRLLFLCALVFLDLFTFVEMKNSKVKTTTIKFVSTKLPPGCTPDAGATFIKCNNLEPLSVVLKNLSDADYSENIKTIIYSSFDSINEVKEMVLGANTFGSLKLKEVL